MVRGHAPDHRHQRQTGEFSSSRFGEITSSTHSSEGWGGHEASSYASGSTASAYGARAGATGDLDSPYVDEDSTGADASLRQGRDLRGDETIPIVEERLRVGKRETGQGRVRVRAYTVEEQVNERVDLLEERVQIARRPVDREIEKDNVDGSRDTLSSVDRDNIDRTKI
ncbi:MAG: DUF2382 domain-containing protein [Alphaproteobacteria bacterium]|nr:DUF2382 domain-containing protein [Alphaproteobacteria bacterium]